MELKLFSEEHLLLTCFSQTQSVEDQKTLVDVGAHHGSFSKNFADKGWQVIAFEPEENNRAAFQENLKEYPQVTCIPKAVSDEAGKKVPFYVSEEHFGIHSLKPWHDTHELAYEVETVRLDSVLSELQVPNVTLLKVDTEGADFLALKGFDWDKYHPELVMIEFSDDRTLPNFNYTHHDVVEFMEKRGYVAFVSEWDEIKEYGRQGVVQEPHTWLQCVPYPVDHQPAWGNLIFVPTNDSSKFINLLNSYLSQLEKQQKQGVFRKLIKKIPGATYLYRSFKH
ncbi:FkbM family methyltransferase [Synechocystis sp. PCC 7338]|uniref:FkbM family methyltransferase n=1 Tax=Synechocystis sp. PCC 7338 TaxID=2732530 RepID=UPI001BAF8FAC|nr:FkbM family methyltransferase [Synechocystis sp. PCC 7338]QUS59968.1 FkbM family methyltransferase [Synechocystis sp. PCC 7338]